MHIDLVDHREIAYRTGVSVDHVSAWTHEPGFPEPVSSLSIGDVWVWGPVWGWLHHEGFVTDHDLAASSLTFTQELRAPMFPFDRRPS